MGEREGEYAEGTKLKTQLKPYSVLRIFVGC